MKQQTSTKLAKLERKREQLDSQIKDARKHITWKCPLCERGTQVRFLNIMVVQYYVPPSGCTDGAYWTEGNKPEYEITCPKCNQYVRLYCQIYDTIPYKNLKPERKKIHDAWATTDFYREDFKSETTVYKD